MNALPTIHLDSLFTWTADETAHWRDWFTANPAALEAAAGKGHTATVRGLVLHIFAVERRYAERLLGEPVSPYEGLPSDPIDALFGVGTQAREKLLRYARGATADDLRTVLTFPTITAGMVSASREKILLHALVHGIRHWAQIATFVRQAGFPSQWSHDFLYTTALP